MSATEPLPGEGPVSPDIEALILDILTSKGRLHAVKAYMDITGHRLKDAKEAVRRIMVKHNIPDPGMKAGCAGVFLLAALIGLFVLLSFGY